MKRVNTICNKFLFILVTISSIAIAADYFPMRPNYSWVYDLIIIEDSVPKDVGDVIYTLGKDTLINGIRHIPRIVTLRDEGDEDDIEESEIGYLIDGNTITMSNDFLPESEPEYAKFYLQHSYASVEGEVVRIDGHSILYRHYGEYVTPCGKYENCISIFDQDTEVVFIVAPDVGVVGCQIEENAECILSRHGPGGANEIMSDNLTPTIIKDKNEDPILLRNGRIWLPSAYSGASRILVYTADGRLIARGGKGKDQIDLSNTGSGMRMLLVKIILGDSMFTTRISIVR